MPKLRRVTADILTRLMIMAVLAGNVLLFGTWVTWQEFYPRGLSVYVFWAPTALASWSLGTLALLSAGRLSLGFAYAIVLPVVGISYGAALLQIASDGVSGLIGIIVLLVAFDAGMILVAHHMFPEPSS